MAVVLLTGCSSGFGLEGALAFARNGDTVYATMRDTSGAGNLRHAAAAESLSVNTRTLDVTRPETFSPLIQEIIGDAGQIDVLVNNAGILRVGALEDISENAIREVMETNFFGPFLLTRTVLPHMRAQGYGYIIMVSSLSGIAGLPGDASYSASKFALEGATESLRHEVDRWGIRVALIEAGLHATDIFADHVGKDAILPDYYPTDSVYRPLVERQLLELGERLSDASSPRRIGDLMVRISRSDGSQLRWPADDVAKTVLSTLLAQDDRSRDDYLRGIAGTAWWSQGRDAPDANS